jgi:hypothetical protein
MCSISTRVSKGKFVSFEGKDSYVCTPGWTP